MSFVKWIKEKYQNRRTGRDDHDPWWVTLMLDVGRPLVAIMILTMCAPGEHYLAVQAGWSDTLAWGMPGALTAYAGIAAVVATKRPKGAPGRTTAIWGAILSVSLAMAAQPVAHLYNREGLTAQMIWLTVVMGVIPGAVFGHLLHMGAATPKPSKAPAVPTLPEWLKPDEIADRQAEIDAGHRTEVDITRDKIAKAFDVPPDMISPPVSTLSEPSEIVFTDFRTEPDTVADNGHRTPDMTTWTGHADTDRDNHPDKVADTGDKKKAMSSTNGVRPIMSGSVSGLVREFLTKNPDASDADLSGHVRARKPDTKWDTIRKARDRFKETQEQTG